jgi:hypothetical protein
MTDEQLNEQNVETKEDKIVLDKTKGHVLDIGPGCIIIELPAGYIHEDGELHVNAVLREMKGSEEELLASKGPTVTRINTIIGNCLVQIGTISDKSLLRKITNDLTAQDRMAILLGLRRVSLGDFYDCKVTCPECNISQHVTINLSEIEISPMPNRMERDMTDTLPSGKEVKWHVIRSEDEEWLVEQRKKQKDLLTLHLLSRIDSIDDEKLDRKNKYRDAINTLKDLSIRDRTALRDLFDKKEDNIDTLVEFECEKCGHQWEGKLDVAQPTFFFPSVKLGI